MKRKLTMDLTPPKECKVRLDTQRCYTIEIRCSPKGKKGHAGVAGIVTGMARLIVATLDMQGCKARAAVYSDDFFKGHEFLGEEPTRTSK